MTCSPNDVFFLDAELVAPIGRGAKVTHSHMIHLPLRQLPVDDVIGGGRVPVLIEKHGFPKWVGEFHLLQLVTDLHSQSLKTHESCGASENDTK